MKDQILKIAKVKSEKEFYKKYPTEEAFMAKHGKQLKKAAMGTAMVKKQLTQLTDWSNPPQAQDGFSFADALSNAQQNLDKSQQETPSEKPGILDTLTNIGGQLAGGGMRQGGHLPTAQGGGIFDIAKAIGGAFTTPGTAATATSAGTAASGGLGDTLGNIFGGAGGAKGIMQGGQDIFKGGFKSGMSQLGTKAGLGAAGKAAGMGVLNAAPQILEGIGQMGEQKKAIKKADQAAQISGLTAQAAESRPETIKNKYVRPEDQMIQGLNPQGGGTNFLAAYGASIGGNPTEIQNTYNPGDLYSDLGYEPLDDSDVKQFAHGGHLPTAEFGDYFQNSGQASVGKGVGSAIGSAFFGPIGGQVGGFLGGVAGNLLGGAADANKLAGYQETSRLNTERAATQGAGQAIQKQYQSYMEDGGWVSNEWQPQVITTFGEHKVKDLLQPPHDADMLRAGGHLKEYTPPSAEAMYTGRAEDGTILDSAIRAKTDLQSTTTDGRFSQNLRDAISSVDTYADGRPVERTDMYTMTKGRDDDQRVKQFLRSQTGEGAPQYSMQKTYKPLFGSQYKTVSKEIGAGRGERRMADMEQFLSGDNMEYGGQMAMGGDLEVHRGKADPISYNPFLPEGGETVMFKGPSHDNGGMPISYGENGVEVEGGEPAVKLADGGSPDGNLVVFGNMKIDNMAANHIGVDAAKGKKYKNFINDLSKFEARQNTVVDKGTELVNKSSTNDPFDQLAMNSGRAMLMGGNAKLLNAAIIKQRAAGVQNAILDTAKEYGIKSDEIAQGNFVIDKDSNMAKFGKQLKKAQDGSIVDYLKGVGKKSDFSSRKALAKDMGISNYSGTAKQNMNLLEKLNTNNAPFSLTPSAPLDYSGNIGDQIVSKALGSNFNNVATTIPYQQGYSNSNLPEVTVSGKRKKGYQPTSANITGVDIFGNYTGPQEPFTDKPADDASKSKFDWKGLAEGVASNLAPIFRPSNQEGLDPNQLYPEMFALASNQLEPVKVQQYTPRLKEAYNISLQDQLNEIDAQARAATRQIGTNPAAASQIFAQAADAKNKIRGEQMRINQASQFGTQAANIDTLNQAQMQNLQLLDQQYGRQAEAKSKTKAQTLEALKSIAAKTAQNKLENRQLGVMENMYNFRFGPRGQAYNINDPYRFNMEGNPSTKGLPVAPEGYEYTTELKKIKSKEGKNGITLNGSIVKALKTL